MGQRVGIVEEKRKEYRVWWLCTPRRQGHWRWCCKTNSRQIFRRTCQWK